MKGYKNLEEVKRGCREVTSCATGSDKFMYKCFPLLIETLIGIDEKLGKLMRRTKRQPTAYNLFIGEQLKAGKSIKEAAKLWRERA
jgi:hypothetical protein